MSSFRPDPNLLKKHPNAVTVDQLGERDRLLGVLLGHAAGEALAASGAGSREVTSGEAGPAAAMTLAVLRTLVARGKLDLLVLGTEYLRWFATKPARLGKTTRAALESLRAGEENPGAIAWEDAGRKAATPGSVACAAPVGVFHARSLEGLAEDAAALSRLTHYDPRCVGAAVAVATAAALLVRGEADEAIERAAGAGRAYSDDVGAAVERGAQKRIEQLQLEGEGRGSALLVVEAAFCALAHATSVEDGLTGLVIRGAEPAAAAVAGALLGGRFGKSAVPDRWTKKLAAAPELASLGEQLWKKRA